MLNSIVIRRPLKLGSLKVACDFTPFLQHLGKPKRKTIALNAQMDILHAPLSETKKDRKEKCNLRKKRVMKLRFYRNRDLGIV